MHVRTYIRTYMPAASTKNGRIELHACMHACMYARIDGSWEKREGEKTTLPLLPLRNGEKKVILGNLNEDRDFQTTVNLRRKKKIKRIDYGRHARFR